jgi:hypothetical protein
MKKANSTIKAPNSSKCVLPASALMKTRILRNIFLSVSVLFALAQLSGAGMNDVVLGFGNTRLGSQPPIITFDAPGSTLTFPSAINPGGAITGSYRDANFVFHGFVRALDGTIPSFDPAGSTTTFASGINPGGRSRDTTTTQTSCLAASCGPPTVPSPTSIHRAP